MLQVRFKRCPASNVVDVKCSKITKNICVVRMRSRAVAKNVCVVRMSSRAVAENVCVLRVRVLSGCEKRLCSEKF